MHKMFKTYINTLAIIGFVIIVYFVYDMRDLQLPYDLTGYLLLSLMTIVSASFVMDYSEDKTLSLYSTFIIFSTLFMPTSLLIGVIFIADLLYKLRLKYIEKAHSKVFDVKFTYNFMVKVIIVGILHIVRIFIVHEPVYIIIASIFYTGINVLTIMWVIRLYNNDLESYTMDLWTNMKELYYMMMTTILMWIGYKGFGYLGAGFVFLFLMSFISYILTPVTHKVMFEQIQKDTLTQLKSRGILDKVLFDKIYEKEPFSLIFIDFDKFKAINDTYGHQMGDAVLKDFALKVIHSFYLAEKMYRFGGDEFCLIVDQDDDLELALYSLEALFEKNVYEEDQVFIEYGVTFGVYHYKGEDFNVSDVISQVSKDMKSKKKGL